MDPRQARRAKAITTLAAMLALAACGGGGGGDDGGDGTTPPPSGGGTTREASIAYDLDHNGTPDATQTMRYDAEGRIVETRYDYTGDGTPDRFEGLGTRDTVTTFSYDAEGRVSSVTETDTTFDFSYGASGLPLRADVSTMGFSGRIDLSHDAAGLLVRAETSLGGTPSGVDRFEYDAAGRRTRELETAAGATTGVQTLYTWNADGTLAAVARDLDADGRDVRYEMSYAGGRQTGTRKSVGGTLLYAVRFVYDGSGRLVEARFDVGGNGSDDAVWTATWETGACRAIVLPLYDPLIDSITGHGSIPSATWDRCAAG